MNFHDFGPRGQPVNEADYAIIAYAAGFPIQNPEVLITLDSLDMLNEEGATKAVDFICNTAGDGYWSTRQTVVRCTKLEITYVAKHDDDGEDLPPNGAPTFGELQVSFDPVTWNPDEDGLIYTDKLFLKELVSMLVALGFSPEAATDVSYSEQGMQGDDFVSCDVGGKFLAEVLLVFAR